MKHIKTPRPKVSQYVRWETARQHAKTLNLTNGRGYRALRAQDGKGYAVIFRHAVASNKQRKVREVL